MALISNLLDGEGGAVLHVYSRAVESQRWNYLVVTLTNTSGDPVTISPGSGPVSDKNANLTVGFTDGFDFSPTFYSATIATAAVGKWQVSRSPSEGAYSAELWLGTTEKVTLAPQATLTIDLQYDQAVPDDPAALATEATVGWQNMTANGKSLNGRGPSTTLRLSAKVGLPQPFTASFVGPSTVPSDNTTPSSLTLRLLNASVDPALFVRPPAGEQTPTAIAVVLPVLDTAPKVGGALCNTAAAGQIKATLSGTAAKGWSVTHSPEHPETITLTPDYAATEHIAASGTLDLTLTNVTSSYGPGQVEVRVVFKSFTLYGTQTVPVTLQVSPLVCGDGPGTGMTLAGGTLGNASGLAVTGDAQAALFMLEQQGSGPVVDAKGGATRCAQLELTQATTKGHQSTNSRVDFSTGGIDKSGRANVSIEEDDGLNLYSDSPGQSVKVHAELKACLGLSVTGDVSALGKISSQGGISTQERYVDKTGQVMPVGAVMPYAGTRPPVGWLLCDGEAIPGEYQELIKLVGADTPNLCGRTVVAAGLLGNDNYALNQTGGEATHKLVTAEMPEHTHAFAGLQANAGTCTQEGGGRPDAYWDAGKTTEKAGDGQSHNNMQPYFVLNYIIKC